MSEAGFLYVAVKPDTRGFASDLDRQLAAQSPRVQASLARTGLGEDLRSGAALMDEGVASNNRLKDAEDKAAAATKKHGQAQEDFAVHAHRANVAGFALRGSTVALGAAALVGVEGLHALAESLKVTGEAADTTTGRLRNAAAAALSGDFATAAKNLGEQARFDLDPGARVASNEADAATARVKQREDAIALAKHLLELREQTAKAEGTIGTAAGVTRFELEKQLRIAQLQYNALAPNIKRIAAGQFGLNPDLSNKVAVQASDSSRSSAFQLEALRRGQTKQLADDRRLFEDRQTFLKGQIGYLENAGAHTQAAKDRLATLYGQLDSVEGQLQALDDQAQAKRRERLQARIALAETNLQIEAANARTEGQEVSALRDQATFARKTADNKNLTLQERKGYELNAAQIDKQIYDIGVAAAERAKAERERAVAEAKRRREEAVRLAKEEIDARRAAYRSDLSLTEQKLGIAVQRAQLTDKNLADDRKAIQAQINYYRKEANDRKLTDSERLNYRSQLIGAQLSLKNLQSTTAVAPKSSAADFFKEAASEYRTYGSNTATRGGILSGQDARAAFAGRVLGGNAAQQMAAVVARDQAQRDSKNLSVQQEQLTVLRTIADRLTYGGATREPAAKGIANARRGAHVVGANT